MIQSKLPRVILVDRPTEYEQLLAQHGTHGQAAFFLKGRNEDITKIKIINDQFQVAHARVLGSIPAKWRRAKVSRANLDRFLFEPEDIIVTLGPDGLIANVAKYLNNQIVIGLNPHPNLYDGVLAKHLVCDAPRLLNAANNQTGELEKRTMVQAVLDDGQSLFALNEIFLGHKSHQSARYQLDFQNKKEYHSSSGIIIISGTGATGWGKSVARAYKTEIKMPTSSENKLVFFVREAFPSKATGVSLVEGTLQANQHLTVISKMDQDGVLFGDGIETDYISFPWGQQVIFSIAEQKLNLLVS